MNTESKKGSKKAASSSPHPFVVPNDLSEFLTQEKENKAQERRRQQTLQLHEKGCKPKDTRHLNVTRCLKKLSEEIREEEVERMLNDKRVSKPEETPFQLVYYHRGAVKDFVHKEEEICRLEYFISVTRKKIQELKQQISLEEEEIAKEEHCFSDEAFEKYIEDEEKKMVLTMNRAEEEEQIGLELKAQTERITREIIQAKKEIVLSKQNMQHYLKCQEFLSCVSPPEWRQQEEARKQRAAKIKASVRTKRRSIQSKRRGSVFTPIRSQVLQGSQSKSSKEHRKPKPEHPEETYKAWGEDANATYIEEESNSREKLPHEDKGTAENLEVYEKPPIYFKDSKQLLDVLGEVEEDINRLFLELDSIEHSMEFFKETMDKEQKNMEEESTQFVDQIESLTQRITKHKVIAAEIQERIHHFRKSGNLKQKNESVKQLQQKITEMYNVCMDIKDLNMECDFSNLSQMLRAIEEYMQSLLGKSDMLPEETLKRIKVEYRREMMARENKKKIQMKERAQEQKQQEQASMQKQQALHKMKVMWQKWRTKNSIKDGQMSDCATMESNTFFFDE